jgi:hypothetical protein
MLGSPFLTVTSDAQRLTEPGMAHFAGTGPDGATCGQCKFRGYWRERMNGSGFPIGGSRSQACAKFHSLTGGHGPAINKNLRACKYFEPVTGRS